MFLFSLSSIISLIYFSTFFKIKSLEKILTNNNYFLRRKLMDCLSMFIWEIINFEYSLILSWSINYWCKNYRPDVAFLSWRTDYKKCWTSKRIHRHADEYCHLLRTDDALRFLDLGKCIQHLMLLFNWYCQIL